MTLGLPPDRAQGGHDPLIRRLRQVVQVDHLLPSVRWADIPQPSTRDRRCPAAWLQYWQQSEQPLQALRQVWFRDLRYRAASYPVQPSSLMARPAFQILVIWLILPSWNSIR